MGDRDMRGPIRIDGATVTSDENRLYAVLVFELPVSARSPNSPVVTVLRQSAVDIRRANTHLRVPLSSKVKATHGTHHTARLLLLTPSK